MKRIVLTQPEYGKTKGGYLPINAEVWVKSSRQELERFQPKFLLQI